MHTEQKNFHVRVSTDAKNEQQQQQWRDKLIWTARIRYNVLQT